MNTQGSPLLDSVNQADLNEPSVIKNFLFLFISDVLGSSINFLTITYLVRVLGVAAFGKINFAEAVLSYFILFTNLGLNYIAAREIARTKENYRQIIGSVMGLKLILCIVTFIFYLTVIALLKKPLEIKILLFLYGLSLLPAALLINWAFNGLEKMTYVAMVAVMAKVVFMIITFIIVKSASQLFIVPVIQFVADILASFSLIFIFGKLFGKIRLNFDRGISTHLLTLALPAGFSLYMTKIYYNFDTIILSFMKGDAAVGYYNSAYKIILFLTACAGTFYFAIFPRVSDYYKSSTERLINFQKKVVKIFVIFAIPLGIGTTLLADKIIYVIFGQAYTQSIIALQILIWAVVIIYIDVPFANFLIPCDRQKKLMFFVTIAALVNLIFNFILIPPLGIRGAAIATVVAELAVFLFSYIEIKKILHTNLFVFLGKPIIASSLMGICIFYLHNKVNVLLLIPGAISFYFLILYVCKGITREDIQFVRASISPTEI